MSVELEGGYCFKYNTEEMRLTTERVGIFCAVQYKLI